MKVNIKEILIASIITLLVGIGLTLFLQSCKKEKPKCECKLMKSEHMYFTWADGHTSYEWVLIDTDTIVTDCANDEQISYPDTNVMYRINCDQ